MREPQEGYRNLINLVSTGYLDGFYYKPRIDKDLLARHSKGLIGLSACLRGDINETLMADKYDEARRISNEYEDIFGKDNFFLELQDHQLDQDQDRDAGRCGGWRGNRAFRWWLRTTPTISQRRCPRSRNPSVHSDGQDDVRCQPDAVHHSRLLYQDAKPRWMKLFGEIPELARYHVGHRAALPSEVGAESRIRFRALKCRLEHTTDSFSPMSPVKVLKNGARGWKLLPTRISCA